MRNPRFSVCIPNYNYAKYLRLTCASVTEQSCGDFEILISDNNSNDGSREFIEELTARDARVTASFNSTNLGFAPNLEKVSSMASGDRLILLSSDDLMNARCLEVYSSMMGLVGDEKKVILGSSVLRIDSVGAVIERSIPDGKFWRKDDIDPALSASIGYSVYKVASSEMLRRSLLVMGNPYYFLTVCYPRELLAKTGGYAGGRMMGPDKWFNWKLFSESDFVILIDEPLFSYRWHIQNQVSLETSGGYLKYLVDEYRNTMELSDAMLGAAGLSRSQSEINFVKRDILRHGIGEFSKGRWLKSFRILFFGISAFPGHMFSRPLILLYFLLILTTPVGAWVSGKLFAGTRVQV